MAPFTYGSLEVYSLLFIYPPPLVPLVPCRYSAIFSLALAIFAPLLFLAAEWFKLILSLIILELIPTLDYIYELCP